MGALLAFANKEGRGVNSKCRGTISAFRPSKSLVPFDGLRQQSGSIYPAFLKNRAGHAAGDGFRATLGRPSTGRMVGRMSGT